MNRIQIKSTRFPFKMHQVHPNQVQIKSKSNQIHNSVSYGQFGEGDATARCIMAQLNTSFVIHLCILKYLLKICADTSVERQGKFEILEKTLQTIKMVTDG